MLRKWNKPKKDRGRARPPSPDNKYTYAFTVMIKVEHGPTELHRKHAIAVIRKAFDRSEKDGLWVAFARLPGLPGHVDVGRSRVFNVRRTDLDMDTRRYRCSSHDPMTSYKDHPGRRAS